MEAQELRIRHVGWRDPQRVQTSTGGHCGLGALGFQRFRQHGSGFQLKKHGIHQLIVIGLIAHTCVEATVRYAAELGYQVTMVKDATADYSNGEMHAALDINIPNYASGIVTTTEIVDSISSH
jgi:isochorismate hydrolase